MSLRKHAHFHPGMGTKEQIANDLYEVREQRDALLKATLRLLAAWDACNEEAGWEPLNEPDLWEAARAAIAKAEGR